jgi:hypothetical protein
MAGIGKMPAILRIGRKPHLRSTTCRTRRRMHA